MVVYTYLFSSINCDTYFRFHEKEKKKKMMLQKAMRRCQQLKLIYIDPKYADFRRLGSTFLVRLDDMIWAFRFGFW